jgi:hypothetical protein
MYVGGFDCLSICDQIRRWSLFRAISAPHHVNHAPSLEPKDKQDIGNGRRCLLGVLPWHTGGQSVKLWFDCCGAFIRSMFRYPSISYTDEFNGQRKINAMDRKEQAKRQIYTAL